MQPALLSNQFFSGGLILMLTGGLMALLRQAPARLAKWLKDKCTVSVLIADRDPLFEWTKLWLDSLPYSRRARQLMCQLYREDGEEFSSHSRMLFAPSYGRHFFRHNRRLVWLEYNKQEQPAAAGAQVVGAQKAPETILLTVLGTKQAAVRELCREIAEFAEADERRRVRGYINTCGWWRRMPQFLPRAIETVDLPSSDERLILSAIEEFLGARKLYNQRGIPYHLNFLFAGRPGTGKTSIASALCGHFGLNLHLLNIAGPGMNDERLVDLMLAIPRRSMILMEDVDAVLPEAKQRPKLPAQQPEAQATTAAPAAPEGITLSGLLNCMDGITAPDGAVIVMTTNHPELISPALLRPGRVDVRVNFGPATREQIERMCRRLNPKSRLNGEVDVMLVNNFTTAEVQAEILKEHRIHREASN